MYLLVNTNFLVPEIKKFDSFDKSIEELQYNTLSRSFDWNNRIYVINENEQNNLYKSDDKRIYMVNLLTGETKTLYTYKKYSYLNTEYWIKYSSTSSNDLESMGNFEYKNDFKSINCIEIKKDNENKNDMSLTINEKKNKNNSVKFEEDNGSKIINNTVKEQQNKESLSNNINSNVIIKDENVKLNEKNNKSENNVDKDENNSKKKEIIKMIEEVNDLYQKELSNIKKLELNLITYDNKLKKLEKTKKDNIINEIIRTQSEYRTWKKIKYGLKEDSDELDIFKPISELEESNAIVPILFLSKYNYIEKIQNNEYIKILLEKINLLDLNELYSNNSLPDNDIIQFSTKYMKLSKELHYHFDDHEWSYLENEMNLNSTNKLGTNVISSSKI